MPFCLPGEVIQCMLFIRPLAVPLEFDGPCIEPYRKSVNNVLNLQAFKMLHNFVKKLNEIITIRIRPSPSHQTIFLSMNSSHAMSLFLLVSLSPSPPLSLSLCHSFSPSLSPSVFLFSSLVLFIIILHSRYLH